MSFVRYILIWFQARSWYRHFGSFHISQLKASIPGTTSKDMVILADTLSIRARAGRRGVSHPPSSWVLRSSILFNSFFRNVYKNCFLLSACGGLPSCIRYDMFYPVRVCTLPDLRLVNCRVRKTETKSDSSIQILVSWTVYTVLFPQESITLPQQSVIHLTLWLEL